jgi:hypothetical protein
MALERACFRFVKRQSTAHSIDWSHGLAHSQQVFALTVALLEHYQDQVDRDQHRIARAAAIVHDMCDRKYNLEQTGVTDIRALLDGQGCSHDFVERVLAIITNMPYSRVKVRGYPALGRDMLPYHIVRNADLLCAYDIRRCIVYNRERLKTLAGSADEREAVQKIMQDRVLHYLADGWINLEPAISIAQPLHEKAQADLADYMACPSRYQVSYSSHA